MELTRLGKPEIGFDRVVDTLQLARRKHPAGPNNLDALCKRYGVDNSKRTKHGALMDSLLLAEVYVELLGERQATLSLAKNEASDRRAAAEAKGMRRAAQRPTPLPPRLTPELEAAHRAFVGTLSANAIWLKYLPGRAGGRGSGPKNRDLIGRRSGLGESHEAATKKDKPGNALRCRVCNCRVWLPTPSISERRRPQRRTGRPFPADGARTGSRSRSDRAATAGTRLARDVGDETAEEREQD